MSYYLLFQIIGFFALWEFLSGEISFRKFRRSETSLREILLRDFFSFENVVSTQISGKSLYLANITYLIVLLKNVPFVNLNGEYSPKRF